MMVESNINKKVLIFSTLNPYPFWAGSENYWFDFVSDKRVNSLFEFHLALADSPETRKKANILSTSGAKASFYNHFNVDFTNRNFYRVWDKINRREFRTLPWFNRIEKNDYDLVWFNVAGLGDLADLFYPVQMCKKRNIPYWLILQHGYEDFFFTAEKEIEIVTEIATSAKKFIFIAKRNQLTLERALGLRLTNAFQSVNALSKEKIAEAKQHSASNFPNQANTAKFFNLGRFSPKDKAQHFLLEALADNQWRDRDWQLSFIGVSDFGKYYLEKLIGFYGLNRKKIEIMAHTENVFAEIVKNDVLLMPSLSEGTPFAIIESMACGKSVLGTPIGGIPELIIENQTGWLARTIDISDISEKLEQVWQERHKWLEFGQNAQKHIETNYNEEKSFAELLELLKEDTDYEL